MIMSLRHPKLAAAVAILCVVFAVPVASGKKKDKPSPPSQMDEQKRALHALNRLTYGPRRVMCSG